MESGEEIVALCEGKVASGFCFLGLVSLGISCCWLISGF